jgi:hypothetical protein
MKKQHITITHGTVFLFLLPKVVSLVEQVAQEFTLGGDV